MELTIAEATRAARVLQEQVGGLTDSAALEIVAQQLGFQDWTSAAASLPESYDISAPIPVLRSFDEQRAREFYVDYLHFTVLWEHRFEDTLPLYLRLRRGRFVVDLSEHHGDGTPGSTVWVPVADVVALQSELHATGYPNLRPGIDHDSPGGPTMEVIDPFSNTIRFCQTSS
ncbi:MAG: glyoxalase superfamily protein [Mycobacterium sp.]